MGTRTSDPFDYAERGRAGQGADPSFAPVMLMPCFMLMPCLPAECAVLIPSWRAAGQHAITRLDAMRSIPKTVIACGLLALAAAGQPLFASSTAAPDAPAAP